jgi:GRIP domain
MAALKDNVKELQLALTREKEFNASGHQINIEYLVNVLRKFFMTENKSERARLVIAVTQILHLRPEECKVIAEKWAVKKGGLVGWFSGTADVGGDEGVPYDAFSDGVAGLNMYA